MAGLYPDVPGRRMAYDRDGSTGFAISHTGGHTVLTTPNLVTLNDESGSSVTLPHTGDGNWFGLVFPQLRDIVGLAWSASPHSTSDVQTSVNTTNGADGTWTGRGALGRFNHQGGNGDQGLITAASIRNASVAVGPWTGVKAIRIQVNTGWQKYAQLLHVYGDPVTTDRLRIWHPTLDQEVEGSYFDWGDVPRSGATLTRTFRVKNDRALTGNSILISMEALTDGSPTTVSQHAFSPDGTTFTSTLNIGALAPGAISGVITLRRITPSNAPLLPWTSRINAVAASWT